MKKALLSLVLLSSIGVAQAEVDAETQALAKSLNTECKSEAVVKDACVVMYFAKDGSLRYAPQEGGFIRVLRSKVQDKKAGDLIVVQDFYAVGARQTDPYKIRATVQALASWTNAEMGSEGPITNWYKEGQKEATVHLHNGKREGLEQFWYPNGKPKSLQNYENGEPVGAGSAWSVDGTKIK